MNFHELAQDQLVDNIVKTSVRDINNNQIYSMINGDQLKFNLTVQQIQSSFTFNSIKNRVNKSTLELLLVYTYQLSIISNVVKFQFQEITSGW